MIITGDHGKVEDTAHIPGGGHVDEAENLPQASCHLRDRGCRFWLLSCSSDNVLYYGASTEVRFDSNAGSFRRPNSVWQLHL